MESFNTYEYGTEQKPVGKWKAYRLLLLLLYALFVVAYFLVIYISRIFPLGALIPLFLWIIVYFTWRYTKPDYWYTVEKGSFTFSTAYGKKSKRRVKCSFRISSAEAIAPRSAITEKINEFAPQRVYSALPTPSAEDAYAALFKDSDGKRCVIYFVATAEVLKLMRFFNSKTVICETRY